MGENAKREHLRMGNAAEWVRTKKRLEIVSRREVIPL